MAESKMEREMTNTHDHRVAGAAIAQLKQQLAEAQKLLLLAKQEFYRLACLGNGDCFGNSTGNVIAQEALAKINGPVEGLILCDAEPFAYAGFNKLQSCYEFAREEKDILDMPQMITPIVLLYAPRRTEK